MARCLIFYVSRFYCVGLIFVETLKNRTERGSYLLHLWHRLSFLFPENLSLFPQKAVLSLLSTIFEDQNISKADLDDIQERFWCLPVFRNPGKRQECTFE